MTHTEEAEVGMVVPISIDLDHIRPPIIQPYYILTILDCITLNSNKSVKEEKGKQHALT